MTKKIPQTDDETQTIAALLKLTAGGVKSVRLQSMMLRWVEELARSEERRKRLNTVFQSVIEGFDNIEEISAHTGIPRTTVYEDLNTLSKLQKIEIRKADSTGKRPRNRYTAKNSDFLIF